jgi:hypothetical protein
MKLDAARAPGDWFAAKQLRIDKLTDALRQARAYIADDLAITIDDLGFGGDRSCVLTDDLEVIEETETLLLTIDAALAVPT